MVEVSAKENGMKFGIMNLFPAEGANDHKVLQDTLEEIQFADQLGFDTNQILKVYKQVYLGLLIVIKTKLKHQKN